MTTKQLIKNIIKVSRIIYHNKENSWGVFCYVNDNKYPDFTEPEVKVSGNFKDIYLESEIEIEGDYYKHPTYGPQINLKSYKIISKSDSKEAVIDFLVRSSISGIGIANANKIYKRFGKDSINIVLHESERLKEISGIAGKTYEKVKSSIDKYLKQEELINFCTKLGNIPHYVINKVYEAFGEESVKKLKENPYSLLNVSSLLFNQVDNIAIKIGIAIDNDERLKAGLLYVLKNESILKGSTGCSSIDLQKVFNKELGFIGNINYQRALNLLEEENKIVIEFNEIFPVEFYNAEKRIAEFLKYYTTAEVKKEYDKNIVEEEIKNFPFELNKEQIKAIKNCLKYKFSILVGAAGSGKSSLTKAIVNILSRHKENIILLSPTGKASKRLSECTGFSAKTIHRFLGVKKDVASVIPKAVPPKSTILIDEASMTDVILLDKVITTMQGDTRLILVGDTHQLPSVQAGNILEDLIKSKIFNVCELTDVMRQSEQSNIIKYCTKVNKGENIEPIKTKDFIYARFLNKDKLEETLKYLYKQAVDKYGLQETQVIGAYKLGKLGINSLNESLKALINPNENSDIFPFAIGDKVKHSKNNYKKEVFNGETGIVKNIFLLGDNQIISYDNIDEDEDVLIVDYGDREVPYTKNDVHELQLSYASTVHASQGSEYKVVFVVLDNEVSNILLIRKIIYTALSRAKVKCILLSTNNCTNTAISNDFYKVRITKLKEFLIGENNDYFN